MIKSAVPKADAEALKKLIEAGEIDDFASGEQFCGGICVRMGGLTVDAVVEA